MSQRLSIYIGRDISEPLVLPRAERARLAAMGIETCLEHQHITELVGKTAL